MKRRALITGVAGGVGRALASAFRSEAWDVVGTDVFEPDDDLNLAEFVLADLSDPDETTRTIMRLAGRELDALVNNAATQPKGTVLTTTADEWDRTFAVNVRAAYLAVQASHEALRERQGAVVNVASVHAVATSPGRAAYVASKGALVALTRAAALELAPDGIRVNAVLPGAVDTPMLHEGLAMVGGGVDEIASRIALLRVAEPADVAEAVVFLADGRRSRHVTGQGLVVDGGALARLSTE